MKRNTIFLVNYYFKTFEAKYSTGVNSSAMLKSFSEGFNSIMLEKEPLRY